MKGGPMPGVFLIFSPFTIERLFERSYRVIGQKLLGDTPTPLGSPRVEEGGEFGAENEGV